MPADPSVAAMHRAILGNNPAQPKPTVAAFEGPQEITVVGGGTPDGVRFTVDGYSSDYAFGPAPFHRPAPGQVPPAGTKGLAHFSADGSKQWIIALFDWPGGTASTAPDPAAPVSHAGQPGYVQAEDGSWVPSTFYSR